MHPFHSAMWRFIDLSGDTRHLGYPLQMSHKSTMSAKNLAPKASCNTVIEEFTHNNFPHPCLVSLFSDQNH